MYFVFLLLLTLTFGLSAGFAQSNDSGKSLEQAHDSVCAQIEPWARGAGINSSIKGINETSVNYFRARGLKILERETLLEKTSSQLFDRYLSGEENLGQKIQECLRGHPEQQDFLNRMSSSFFRNSLSYLERAKSKRIQRFLELIQLNMNLHSHIPLIRTVRSSVSGIDFSFKAGFHRGAGSITMDLDRILPREWLVILVHELLHANDLKLVEEMRIFARAEIPLRLAVDQRQLDSIGFFQQPHLEMLSQVLSPEDHKANLDWMRAALGRGFLAEYRAWLPTLLIYQDGLSEGLWPKIQWVEQILLQRREGEPFAEFVFRYLDERAVAQNSEIFETPLVQLYRRLVREELRDEVFNQHRLPDLGHFQRLIDSF